MLPWQPEYFLRCPTRASGYAAGRSRPRGGNPLLAGLVTRDGPDRPGQLNPAWPQPDELHAAGTVPPGTSLNRPHRLVSPTFQTPFSYTAVPTCPGSSDFPPDVML
jgi:hypothetical protein